MKYPALFLIFTLISASPTWGDTPSNRVFRAYPKKEQSRLDESVKRALRLSKKLDRSAHQAYMVSVTTVETKRSREKLFRLGFRLSPMGKRLSLIRGSDPSIELEDLLSNSRSRSTQMLRISAASPASIFVGKQTPIVTSQSFPNGSTIRSVSTMDSGLKLLIKAITPSGSNGVIIGLATEASELQESPNSLPSKIQFKSETTVRAEFGKPILLAMNESIGSGGTVESSTRLGYRHGRASLRHGRRRRRSSGLTLLRLLLRKAP